MIKEFAKLTEQFCLWTESLRIKDDVDLNELLILLSALFNKALLMPLPEINNSDEEAERLSQKEWNNIHKKFTPIQFQYYREIFDPHDFNEDEPVTGDLHDDLADIYGELKPALLLFQKGFINEAAFEWKSSFGYHWGEHILSAMRSIYMFNR
jgi:hypothetical protein